MATIEMIAEELKKKQAGTATPVQQAGIGANLPGGTYMQQARADVGDAYQKGGIPAAIGSVARGALGALPVIGIGASKMAMGIAGKILDPAATALRTAVTGDATPIREVMARDAVAQPAPQAAVAAEPIAAQPVVAAAPAVQAVAQPVSPPVATPQLMPRGIGDLPSGAGMIRNNSTGKVATVGNDSPGGSQRAPEQRIAAQPASQQMIAARPAFGPSMVTPARKAAEQSISEHNRLMATPDGGIGAGLVARGVLNKARAFGDIAATQSNADTARQHADVSAQEAVSRDTERQAQQKEIQRKAGQDQKVNDLRDQYVAHDDKTDPDGKQRQSLKNKLEILSGKDGDQYQVIMGRDELGNPQVAGILDKKSGRMTDPSGTPVKPPDKIPAGMKQVGTSNGAPVYEDAKGDRFTAQR